MEISNNILEQFVNLNLNNKYFQHADETYEKLKHVKEKDFISDYVCLAVKTLERYYKGFLLEAMDQAGYVPPYSESRKKNLLEYSHNVKNLRLEITQNYNDVFPNMTTSNKRELDRKLSNYSNLYTNSSYDDFSTFDKLQEILQFTEKEYKYISDYLSKDRPFGDYTIDLD